MSWRRQINAYEIWVCQYFERNLINNDILINSCYKGLHTYSTEGDEEIPDLSDSWKVIYIAYEHIGMSKETRQFFFFMALLAVA